MISEPRDGTLVIAASAGGPALRSPASKIGARRDVRLLGGAYLWYHSAVLVMSAECRTSIPH
jgi:hypothetical protein